MLFQKRGHISTIDNDTILSKVSNTCVTDAKTDMLIVSIVYYEILLHVQYDLNDRRLVNGLSTHEYITNVI